MKNMQDNSEAINLLKPAEVSRMLNVSKSTVYRILKSGALPTVKVGFSKRVHPDDLNHFIDDCRKSMVVEID